MHRDTILRLLSVLILGVAFQGMVSGQATVRGKITDDNGESLIGATVTIKSNPSRGTITDFDGNYSLKIPAGSTEILLVSYISYQPQELEVRATEGEVIIRDFILVPANIELEDVVVTARASRSDDSYMRRIKLKSAVSMDYISKETIQKIGDSQVDDAIKRIPGASTVSGFITVRGLADRYIKTTVNGTRIPTLDPLTNNIKLDIFPTSLIDNIIISKTQSPDKPADWSGAYISVETKDYPRKLSINVKSTFGFNPQTSFRKYVSSKRSNTDWLGFDNSFRNIDHGMFSPYDENPSAYLEFQQLGYEQFLNDLGINETHLADPTGRYAGNVYYFLGLVEMGILPPAYFYDTDQRLIAQDEYFYGLKQDAKQLINADAVSFGTTLPNSWLTIQRRALMNFSQDISIGNQVELFGRPLGLLASLRYSTSVDQDPNGRNNTFYYDLNTDTWQSATDYVRKSSVETNRWNALLTAAFKPDNNNSVSLTYMANFAGVNKARIDSGFNANAVSEYDFPYLIKHDQSYEQRRQILYQFRSTHFLPGPRLKIESNASYTDGLSSLPDFKSMGYGGVYDLSTEADNDIIEGLYKFAPVVTPEREYRVLDEDIFDASLSAEMPFLERPGLPRKLKFGGSYIYNRRESEQYLYIVNGDIDNDTTRDVEAYFNHEQFDFVTNPVSGYTFVPLRYSYNSSDVNFSLGASTIISAYGMIDFAILPSLRVSGGARYESTSIFADIRAYREQELPPGDPERVYPPGSGPLGLANTTADPSELEESHILPSANVILKVLESEKAAINARFNYSKSLARPSIRELSPFWAYDYELSTYVIGNPDLKITRIDNFDLRLESYYQSGDNLSLSLFNKQFANHIEITNEGVITWRNASEGKVYGVELEGKKVLLKNLELSANFTYVYSTTRVTLKQLGAVTGETVVRPMFGQAPYIFNGLIAYSFNSIGLVGGLSFNVQGPKLAITSVSAERPDIYELPRKMLDFKLSKSLGEHFTLEFKARNILNAAKTLAYDGDGLSAPSWSNDSERERIKNMMNELFSGDKHYLWEYPFESYRYGTTFSVSIGYEF